MKAETGVKQQKFVDTQKNQKKSNAAKRQKADAVCEVRTHAVSRPSDHKRASLRPTP